MATVSIVVRALNEAEHLPALLDGIEAQSRQPTEIVLVDSGSTDDTVAICEKAGARVVHIAPADFSFGRALNVGCQAAVGEVLVFVSAHVYPVDELWLERLVAPFDEHEVALSYGRQTGDHRTKFSELELMRGWFPERSDPDQRHPFCNNANCAVRRSVWEDQPYDEELTGLEDLAWARLALENGWRIAYQADASIVHVHEEPLAATVNRYRREAIAHQRIYGDQRMGRLEALGLFLANCARDYLSALPRRRLLGNLVSIPLFRGAQFYGTWQGFRQGSAEVTTALKRRFYYPRGFANLDGSGARDVRSY